MMEINTAIDTLIAAYLHATVVFFYVKAILAFTQYTRAYVVGAGHVQSNAPSAQGCLPIREGSILKFSYPIHGGASLPSIYEQMYTYSSICQFLRVFLRKCLFEVACHDGQLSIKDGPKRGWHFPRSNRWGWLDQGGIIVRGVVDLFGNGMPGHFRPFYRLQQGQKGIGFRMRADPGGIAAGRKDDGHAMMDVGGQRIGCASNYRARLDGAFRPDFP